MSRVLFALAMLAVVATAAWAYNVNYRTAETLDRIARLEGRIEGERERIAVLAVEWARLNAPDRLRAMVSRQNDRLLLMPMAADHFGETAQVPYPPRPALPATPETDPDGGPPVALVAGDADPAASPDTAAEAPPPQPARPSLSAVPGIAAALPAALPVSMPVARPRPQPVTQPVTQPATQPGPGQ